METQGKCFSCSTTQRAEFRAQPIYFVYIYFPVDSGSKRYTLKECAVCLAGALGQFELLGFLKFWFIHILKSKRP